MRRIFGVCVMIFLCGTLSVVGQMWQRWSDIKALTGRLDAIDTRLSAAERKAEVSIGDRADIRATQGQIEDKIKRLETHDR